jgi:hypothetical protein
LPEIFACDPAFLVLTVFMMSDSEKAAAAMKHDENGTNHHFSGLRDLPDDPDAGCSDEERARRVSLSLAAHFYNLRPEKERHRETTMSYTSQENTADMLAQQDRKLVWRLDWILIPWVCLDLKEL